MKRYLWLFVLPWAVVVSSDQSVYTGYSEHGCEGGYSQLHGMPNGYCHKEALIAGIAVNGKPISNNPCNDVESCQDYVDAMNEAHERRTGNQVTCQEVLDLMKDQKLIEDSQKTLDRARRR